GTVFLDADLDGHLDIAVANGHVQRNNEQISGNPTAQEAQLFRGDGHGRFRDVSGQAGAYFGERYLGRGLAWADFDNDGRPDLAVGAPAGIPRPGGAALVPPVRGRGTGPPRHPPEAGPVVGRGRRPPPLVAPAHLDKPGGLLVPVACHEQAGNATVPSVPRLA